MPMTGADDAEELVPVVGGGFLPQRLLPLPVVHLARDDRSPDAGGTTGTPPADGRPVPREPGDDRSPDVDVATACPWCGGPIPPRARFGPPRVFCSKGCKKHASRRRRRVAAIEVAAATPCRLAVADPPYIGKADLYADHPDYGGEVDHVALLTHLDTYDGWVLAASADSVPAIFAILADLGIVARLAIWTRGRIHPGRVKGAARSWEAVFYRAAREITAHDGVADSLVAGSGNKSGLLGRKPDAWCSWVFGLLGASAIDDLDDLFPGTGQVADAWARATGAPSSRDDRSPPLQRGPVARARGGTGRWRWVDEGKRHRCGGAWVARKTGDPCRCSDTPCRCPMLGWGECSGCGELRQIPPRDLRSGAVDRPAPGLGPGTVTLGDARARPARGGAGSEGWTPSGDEPGNLTRERPRSLPRGRGGAGGAGPSGQDTDSLQGPPRRRKGGAS